jgi:prophage regulatory protein
VFHIQDRLVPLSEVRSVVGLSRTEIYRRIGSNDPVRQFPAPVKLGRASRWRMSSLQDWIERQAAISSPK